MRKPTKIRKAIDDPYVGDQYTYVGIERNTKLVLAWHIGQRDGVSAETFAGKLDATTSGEFQFTTDGLKAYIDAVRYTFAPRCDYAQLIKVYGKDDVEGERKYAPPAVVETTVKKICSSPDPRRICTSIVERSNLKIRMTMRRLTRLTNAFSKKWENLYAMMALSLRSITSAA